MRRARLTAGVALALSLLAGSGCRDGEEPQAPPPPPEVPVRTLSPREVEVASRYLGRVDNRRSVEVFPQTSAYVERIRVAEGARVKAGQVLVELDARGPAAELGGALAAVEEARSAAALAERERRRADQLHREGILSRQDRERAVAEAAAARARLRAAQAEARARAVQREFRAVTAPFAGTVGAMAVRVGDYVTPQTQLTTLQGEGGALELTVEVPLERAQEVRVGDSRLDLLGDDGVVLASARVSFLAPEPDPQTQLVAVRAVLAVDEEGAPFAGGQRVRAQLVTGTEQVLTVPSFAVTRQAGQAFVFLVLAHGEGPPTVERRPVTLGRLLDEGWVVTAGLAPGDRVAVGQLQALRDGAPIHPVEEAGR